MPFLRKYGTGTGADIIIPVIKRGVVDYALGADWTPAAGDVKINIDGAGAASITTLPTAVTYGNTALWKFTFANAELQGKRIEVTVADAATKAVEDQCFIIETYGNASAMYPTDLSAAILAVNTTQFGGQAVALDANNLPGMNVVDWKGAAAPANTGDAYAYLGTNLGALGAAATAIPTAVWASGTRTLTSFGTLTTDTATAVWNALTSSMTTAGSIGLKLKNWVLGSDSKAVLSTDETGAGLTSVAPASTALSTAQWTNTRAAKLDNLDVASSVLQTAINNLNNLSALANLYGPQVMEIPDSSSTSYPFTLTIRDSEGHLVALDATPTITAANAAGTDRSANLSAVTNPSTGVYQFTYSVASSAAEEGLRIAATGAVSSSARRADFSCTVANYDSITTLAAIKAKTDNLPSDPASESSVEAAITSAKNTLATDITNATSPLATHTDATTIESAITALGSPMQAGNVTLAASQPNYAPAKAGDAMTVTGDVPGKVLGGGTSTITGIGANVSVGSVTVSGYAAGQDPATLVLDATASSHNTAGSVGQKINSAGGAADPLLEDPSTYAQGTAGFELHETFLKSQYLNSGTVFESVPVATVAKSRSRPRRVMALGGDAPTFRSRVCGALGAPLTQASFSAITYEIFDLGNTSNPSSPAFSGSISVSSSVFNTVQTPNIDPTWQEDTVGYNFAWQPSVDDFKPVGGSDNYRVEIRATAAGGGQPFWVGVWDVEIVETLTALGSGQ